MVQYPGQDTEFFVVLNGVTTGPLVGLEQVEERRISADTPVWYEGLSDWQPAIMAPLTRQLFTADSAYRLWQAGAAVPEADVAPVAPEPVAQVSALQPQTADAMPAERPKPYMIWAIVVAVLFNIVCGIIALVYSVKVKTKYAAGNVESAGRCSVTAQWWIAVGICVGLIMTVYNLFTGALL